jgi:hypothetical protein
MSLKQGRAGVVRRRRVTLVSLVVAAFTLPVAIAFACNPQAHVSLDRTAYQPGAPIAVHGSFFATNAAVTVSGPTGSVPVTTSPGGGFTVQMNAPTSPGNYTITASKPTGGFAAASFSVAAPASTPAASASQPATASPTTQSAPARTPSFNTPSVARSRGTATAQRQSPARSTTPSRSTTPARSTAPARSQSNTATAAPRTTGTTTVAGQRVFAGSTAAAAPARTFATAPATPATRPQRSGATPRPAAAAPAPAQQAALSDLFSNYQPGRTPSLTSQASGAPAGGAGSGLGLGIGLLAFGLFALVAGLTAAEVRRRRPV